MIIKNYVTDQGDHHQERRYSAPAITFCEKRAMAGHPDMDLVCTSHVERLEPLRAVQASIVSDVREAQANAEN